MTAPAKKKAAPKTDIQTVEVQTLPTQSVHPGTMIQAMIENHKEIDIVQMQGMFELQKQYDDELARRAYNDAKARFSAIAPIIDHNKETSFEGRSGDLTQYSYANLAGELEQIKPALAQCGLHPSWRTQALDEGTIIVTCLLTHSQGYQEETSLPSPRMAGRGNTGMNDLQAMKSTIEYLRRMTLESLLGLATDKSADDDGLAGGGPRKEPGEPEAKPEMPAKLFADNKSTYEERILSGKGTVAALIAKLTTKYTLTPEQIQVINNMSMGD